MREGNLLKEQRFEVLERLLNEGSRCWKDNSMKVPGAKKDSSNDSSRCWKDGSMRVLGAKNSSMMILGAER